MSPATFASRTRLARVVATLALITIPLGLRAQTAAQDPAAGAPKAEKCQSIESMPAARVVAAHPADTSLKSVELRHEIVLEVANLNTLLLRQQCQPTTKKLVLYLGGRPIPGLEPYPPVDPKTNTLHFELRRNEDSRDAWAHLLGRPSFNVREFDVSVGLTDDFPIPSNEKIRIRAIPIGWFAVWASLLAFLIVAFGLLAVKSNLLRDPGPEPGLPDRKPYSLAKMQAAVWFFLVLIAYLFIGLVAGDYSTSITTTVLGLMGISAATAVGSATIDAGQAAATPNAAPATPAKSRKWWLDILSDENGVNFHRFQMAAWTAVLGLIFVHDVYIGLAMPTFDVTLLGLMGISAGTYLGLKTTSEKDK